MRLFETGWTKQVELLIDSLGLRLAWLEMLHALLAEKPAFSYIAGDKIFAEVKGISASPLEGLSIGEVSVLYEYSLSYVDRDKRKANGQFFTPDDVAVLMARKALDFPKGVWLDPCSGIGNLSWHLVNQQPDKEAFLLTRLVLSDKDPLALLIARTLFTLSFQDQRKSLWHDLEENFVEFDFLSVADENDTPTSTSPLSAIPNHDFVIVNPPYLGLRVADHRFETAEARDLYAYFIENIAKTSKGFVAITPQSFTNAAKFRVLRGLLNRRFPYLSIYCFDNIPGNIFMGVKFGSANSNSANSMRTAITVARETPFERTTTSLIRWRTSERAQMFSRLENFRCSFDFNGDFIPKVNAQFQDLYTQSRSWPTLGDLLSQRSTEHALYLAASPRYFISATRSPLSRSSTRTLYFQTSENAEYAYLLLNSSFTYWWWRVRDGGMTLGLETLRSLPCPVFPRSGPLLGALRRSEGMNRVTKMNAGALQENVKHPESLVLKINRHVLPAFADLLALTHANSDLIQLDYRTPHR